MLNADAAFKLILFKICLYLLVIHTKLLKELGILAAALLKACSKEISPLMKTYRISYHVFYVAKV